VPFRLTREPARIPEVTVYFWAGGVVGEGVVLGAVVGASVRFAVVELGPRKLSPKNRYPRRTTNAMAAKIGSIPQLPSSRRI
jgi:hypothetical protein